MTRRSVPGSQRVRLLAACIVALGFVRWDSGAVQETPKQKTETTAKGLLQGPFSGLQEALTALGQDRLDDCLRLRNGRILVVFHTSDAGPAPAAKMNPRTEVDISAGKGTEPAPRTTFGSYSGDGGRTWSEPFRMLGADGKKVDVPGLGSLLELKSGALGVYYRTSDGREGWGGNFQWWRRSNDGGKTWSNPTQMVSDPPDDKTRLGRGLVEQGVSHNGRGFVLKSGRVVIPAANMLYGPILPRQIDKDWRQEMGEGTKAYQWGLDHFGTLIYGFCFLSDDEGQSWRRSLTDVFVVLPGRYPVQPQARGGFYNFEETTAIELKDGRVMMLGRSILGRPFVSFSKDLGETFYQPVPLELASPDAPAMLARVPKTGDILLVWNQTSVEENLKGYSRHRLSTAISKDEGQTWSHFRNIESLDDVTRIDPPPLGQARWDPQQPLDVAGLHGVGGPHYLQPEDRRRYVRAPGPLRVAYPSCRLVGDIAIIRYQVGSSPPDTVFPARTKQQILPVSWLYDSK